MKKVISFSLCFLLLICGVVSSPLSVKAEEGNVYQTEEEKWRAQDSVPGLLDPDDCDTPAEYQEYMTRQHTFGDYVCRIVPDTKYFYKSGTAGYVIKIEKYVGKAKKLTIPKEIKGSLVVIIGKNSFSDCSSMTSIQIPETVTKIEKNAFKGCNATIKKASFLKKKSDGSYAAMAKISYTKNGKTKTASYASDKTTKITTTNKNKTIKKGKSTSIKTQIYISGKKKAGNLDTSILKFSSSNKKVATVSSKGKIKGLKKGKATITVRMRTCNKSYKIKVKVK